MAHGICIGALSSLHSRAFRIEAQDFGCSSGFGNLGLESMHQGLGLRAIGLGFVVLRVYTREVGACWLE